MIQQEDSRGFTRFPINCRMDYKLVDDDRSFDAICINISGAGILFHARQPVDLGKAVQVRMDPGTGLIPPFMAFVEIVRCKPTKAGDFLLAGSIKGIKSVC